MVELFLNSTCCRCPSKLLQVICVVKYFCHQIQDLCCYRKSSLQFLLVHVQFGILLKKYFFTKIPVARCLQPDQQVRGTVASTLPSRLGCDVARLCCCCARPCLGQVTENSCGKTRGYKGISRRDPSVPRLISVPCIYIHKYF